MTLLEAPHHARELRSPDGHTAWSGAMRRARVIPLVARSRIHERQHSLRQREREQRRECGQIEGLQRLIALLEARSERSGLRPMRDVSRCRNPLSRLARLRAAHAAYTLQSTGCMRQASPGVWYNVTRLGVIQ